MKNNLEIKQIPLEEALEFSNKVGFIVLPGYILESLKSEFYLTTYTDGQFVIAGGVENIEEYHHLRLGDLVFLELEGGKIKISTKKSFESGVNPRLGFDYNPGRGLKMVTANKTKLYQGQNIIIRGGNGVGKTRCATKIADGFEKNGFETYRVLIRQRRDDSLGENTIVIDSPSIEYQMEQFYYILNKVFRDAHEGKDCCLVIDSIDKFITLQSGRMTNGLFRILQFVHSLFRLSGNFVTGSITILCTNADYDSNISTQLKSFSEAQIYLSNLVTNGEADYSRKPNLT